MTQQEVMKTFMTSLKNTEMSGRSALDEAVKASSSFVSYEEVVKKFGEDWEKSGGNWHRFLVEKCGIILDNEDTGAVSGADCGSDTVKGAEDILPSKGSAKYPSGTSFTVRGLTIYGIPPKDSLTADQQYVVRGLYSWWIRDALKQIEQSYGLTFKDETTTNARLKLEFIDDSSINAVAAIYFDSTDGNKKEYESSKLMVNMAYFKNMSSSDRHGTVSNGSSLDRTLIHEMVHSLMASNVNYLAEFPLAIIEGGTAELIHGIDDKRRSDIIEYAKDLSKVVEFLSTQYVVGTEATYEEYAGGYIFMRYFLKQAAEDTTFDYDTYREKVTIGSSGGFATNYFDEVTMTGGKSSDTITNSGANVLINAGAGADTIKNYNSNVVINAGSGADKIGNEGEGVSIGGGSGNDIVINNGASATISGGTGNDNITNIGAESVIYCGTGSDTVTNAAANTQIFGGAGNDYVSNYDSGSTIYGGTGIDTLTNSGSGAVIVGDKGNDLLLNTGNETVVLGDKGNDVIYNGYTLIEINNLSSADILNDDSDSDSGSTTESTIGGALSTVHGGEGDDSITNRAEEVMIFGGEGIDTVINSGGYATISGDDDEDIIYNEGAGSYILGGADDDSVSNEGQAVIVELGKGADTVTNTGTQSTLQGNAGDDIFYNNSEKSYIFGGAGNDSVTNYGDETKISGGAGADTIYSSGIKVMITGGAGNDSIVNEGAVVVIEGGSGNDYIQNSGDHITISGGKGNDSIVNDGGKHLQYNFSSSGGQDTVIGANDSDTLYISTTSYSTLANGDDLTVKVGKGSIIFQDLGSKNIIISNGSKNVLVSASGLFADDENNFSELDAIIENNFSVAEFENYPAEKISAKNIITYAK